MLIRRKSEIDDKQYNPFPKQQSLTEHGTFERPAHSSDGRFRLIPLRG